MKSLLMGLRSSRPFLETYNSTFFFHSFERFLSIIGVCVCVWLPSSLIRVKSRPRNSSHARLLLSSSSSELELAPKVASISIPPFQKDWKHAPLLPPNPKIKCYDPKKWRRIRRVCIYTHFGEGERYGKPRLYPRVQYYVQIGFPQNSPPLRNHESSTYENTKTTCVIFAYQNEQMSQYWK